MSILDLIRFWCNEERRLVHLPPLMPSLAVKRSMIVSIELAETVTPPWPDTERGLRFGQLRAQLDHFTIGGMISIGEDPYKKKRTAYMARLDPVRDEAWQIRSFDPKPAIRVFGHFAQTDVFVALTWAYRKPLGGPGSKAWNEEINGCKAEWRKLFPSYAPHHGSQLSDYVSENFIAV